MKKKLLFGALALFAALFLSYYGLLRKPAIKINIDHNTEVSMPKANTGEEVRLLCRPTQVTGALFLAEAMEISENVFCPFESGRAIYIDISGRSPYDDLVDEVVLYGDHYFVLQGALLPTDEADVYHLDIVMWDVVYPVRSLFRFWPFTKGLFSFDFA